MAHFAELEVKPVGSVFDSNSAKCAIVYFSFFIVVILYL